MKKFLLSQAEGFGVTSFLRKASLGLLLAFATLSASADATATFGTDSVTLRDKACPASVLERITPEHRSNFRKADGLVNGKPYLGCWVLERDVVFLMWEDGDQGIIPAKNFKEAKSV